MLHTHCRTQAGPTFRSSAWGICVLAAFVVFGGQGTAADPQTGGPDPKSESKQPPAQFREYLPTLLRKTLLENEREAVATIQRILGFCRVQAEGGITSEVEVGQVEQELLQARVRLLRWQTDYSDSLDRFKHRFEVAPDRLQRWENEAARPLTRQFRRFEDVLKDMEALRAEVYKHADAESASKLRPLIEKSVMGSDLVKNTAFRTRFPSQWAAWQKHEDVGKALNQYRAEQQQLLDRRRKSESKGQPFPPEDSRRLEEVGFQVALGSFEQDLRSYESQPWKLVKDESARQSMQASTFRIIWRGLFTLIAGAEEERLAKCRQSWPALPSVRIEDVELLTCDPGRAEKVVTAVLKKPDAAAVGRMRVRKLRELAETYRLQQRLFELGFQQLVQSRIDFAYPMLPLDIKVEPPLPGLIAPTAPRPQPPDPAALTRQLLTAERSSSRAKAQLHRTWFDYQMARLDLYRDLKLPPP